jgi:hypothetical protein
LTAAPTAMGAFSTSDLERAIFDTIFDTKPTNYFDSLKLLVFSKAPVSVSSDVFSWDESPLQRIAITIDDGSSDPGTQLTAAQSGVAGTFKTATVPVTAAQLARIGLNQQLFFTADVQASVYAKNTTDITIKSLTGEGLPAIIQGGRIVLGGEIVGDSTTGWKNVQRGDKIQRYNYLTTIRRAIKYGRKELANLQDNERNNNMEQDKRNLLDEIKFDALQDTWYGRKAPRLLDDGNYAKGMDGVYTMMKAAGSTFASTDWENLIASFEQHAVATNQQSAGGTRTAYGTSKALLKFSEAYKESRTRFTPESTRVNLDLEQIHLGGQNVNLVAVDIFGDPNYLPADCANRIFVLQDDTIDPVYWPKFPMMDFNRIMSKSGGNYENLPTSVQDNIQRQDFHVKDAEMNFSLRMLEPRKSFCLEIED